MRTVATMGILAAVLVIGSAGCGTARPASSTGAPPPNEVGAYAEAVNLRFSDVSGLLGHSPERLPTRIDGAFGKIVEACDGARYSGEEVLGIGSGLFSRSNASNDGVSSISLLPIESVNSAVYVFPSAALAARAFSVADSARARSCLIRLARSEPAVLRREGSKVKEQHFTEAAVSVLPSPLAHTPIYWVRATGARPVPARGTTGRSKFYYDRFGFVIGRALVTLSATGDPHPFPPATERDLLSMLEARAKARNL